MSTASYTHLLFDLDHTLWDFERNSEETLRELFEEFELGQFFTSADHFLGLYHPINSSLWLAYGRGRISKNKVKYDRFAFTLREVNIADSHLIEHLSDTYVARSPLKKHLFFGALDTLASLHEKYRISIITNGFNEVQFCKIEHSGLAVFIDQVITSEDAGFQKPASEFFSHVVAETQVRPQEALVIGDNLITDIKGAKDFGFDTVFFNPERKRDSVGASFEIQSLPQLLHFL